MVYIFLGPSGSGKDTQANLLSKRLNIPVTSPGELMRREVKIGSEIGKKIDPIMQSGEWIPDEITMQILKNEISKPEYRNGFILTGCPRRVTQIKLIDNILSDLEMTLGKVVHFDLTDEESMNRMRQQAKEADRNDETEEAMKGRLHSYKETINPILEEYGKRGDLIYVDAGPSIEEIQKVLVEKLGV